MMRRHAAWLAAFVLACAIAASLSSCGLFGGGGGGVGGSGGVGSGGGAGGAGGVSPDQPNATQVNESYVVRTEDVVIDEETGDAYVSGVLLVYFDPAATEEQRSSAVALVGGTLIGRMDAFDEYQLRVDAADEQSLEQLCSQLESAPGVDVVTLDRVSLVGGNSLPNDPWGARGIGTTDNSWWVEAIDAPDAWDLLEQTSYTPVRVAVVDSGFDLNHEDLAGRVGRASAADAANRNVRDHGTHVAGIIGAIPDNGRGLAGLVWKGEVLCYDASPTVDPTQSDALPDSYLEQALLESVHAGARVINFSNGASRSHTASEWLAHSDDVARAGRVYSRRVGALLNEGYDFVVVQSAGNGDTQEAGIDAQYNLEFAAITADNCDSSYVSASEIMDRIIIVGAAERDGSGYRLTSFSNGGSHVDVCAPGKDVYSSIIGGYGTKSGTSMAAPIVSGIATLVWSMSPGLSGREVKQLVSYSASENARSYPGASYDSSCEYPLVNANTAVYMAYALSHEDLEEPTEPTPAAEDPALESFERYLRDLYDDGIAYADTVAIPVEGGETDTYYQFAVGDFDGDGAPELFCSHESTGPYGNSFGCLNDVIEYVPGSGNVLARRCITSSVPSNVSFSGNGYVRFSLGAGGSGAWCYMPTSDALASRYSLPDTSYLEMESVGGTWHLFTCSAFSVDGDRALSDAEHDQLVAEFEGSGALGCSVQTMDLRAIEALSTAV